MSKNSKYYKHNKKINMENQPSINIADAPWVNCSCGSYLFKSTTMIKKISQFESPTGKEEHAPIDIVICETCGKIPSFIASKIKGVPDELLEVKNTVIIDGE
jgi:hypothetical protein